MDLSYADGVLDDVLLVFRSMTSRGRRQNVLIVQDQQVRV